MFVDKLIQARQTTRSPEPLKCIWSLIDFYRKNGLDEMLLGDIASPANWGITVRNNEKVLVIIDAGFDKDVYNTYYDMPSSRKGSKII